MPPHLSALQKFAVRIASFGRVTGRAIGTALILSLLAPAPAPAQNAPHLQGSGPELEQNLPAGFHRLQPGDPAPDFKLTGVDDKSYTLADFKQHRFLLVVFLSNHCPSSHAAESRMVPWINQMKERGLGVVAIQPNNPDAVSIDELGFSKYSDSFAEMKLYSSENHFTFPYLYDGEKQETAKTYGALADLRRELSDSKADVAQRTLYNLFGSKEDIVASARRRPGTHNARRRFVEAQVLRSLAEEYRSRRSRGGTDMGDDAPTQEEQADLAQRLRRVPEVAEALDRMWPRLSPHEFLHDLFGARPLLVAAGKGILSEAEVQRLYRPRSTSLDAVHWTVADTALIDEARTLLGPRRGGRTNRVRAQRSEEASSQDVAFWPQGLATSPVPVTSPASGSEDDIRSFGHIVVDEVQDLSPMQLRMLARRSLSGSMTVVGDIAQATGPWAPQEWNDVTRHLSPQRPPRLVELTVSYRTPSEVVALAARVLAVAAPPISPPRPVRQAGATPRIVQATHSGLAATVADIAREETVAVFPGRVAVLGPAVMLPELTRALADARLDPVDPRDPGGDGLAAGLVVLPADETNGLEFDSVIVVEPSLIAAVGDEPAGEGPPVATTRGLRTLYVALTRPTKRLAVVHVDPLPVELL